MLIVYLHVANIKLDSLVGNPPIVVMGKEPTNLKARLFYDWLSVSTGTDLKKKKYLHPQSKGGVVRVKTT